MCNSSFLFLITDGVNNLLIIINSIGPSALGRENGNFWNQYSQFLYIQRLAFVANLEKLTNINLSMRDNYQGNVPTSYQYSVLCTAVIHIPTANRVSTIGAPSMHDSASSKHPGLTAVQTCTVTSQLCGFYFDKLSTGEQSSVFVCTSDIRHLAL